MILNAIAAKLKRRSKDDFKGRHFEAALIVQAVSWYLRYPLSYRDIEEMLLERGLEVDHSTLNRWVLAYAPLIERRLRHFRKESELLEVTPQRVDLAGGCVVFRTLKKRRAGVYRAVPVPPATLDHLDLVHRIREAVRRGKGHADKPLWPWSRMTVWRRIRKVLEEAGIADGPHRCPKGLRHGYGVYAISSGVPLNMLCKWMGHASMETTAIYANALGAEEQGIAARMWG